MRPPVRQQIDRLPLGDVLQRLARLDPQKVHAITLLARAALRQAERTFVSRFKRDPVKARLHPDWKRKGG